MRAVWMCVTLLFVSSEAAARGVDGLRESAKAALTRGEPAQAVADLRRARASTLAVERESELRAELEIGERAWIASLVETARALAPEVRIPRLLAFRREAKRIGSTGGLALVETALDDALRAVWDARDRGQSDEAALRLLSRLTATAARPSSLDAIQNAYERSVREKIARFVLAGADGSYVRDRLGFFYGLREQAPADPHPASWTVKPSVWRTGSCGAALDAVRSAFEGRTGTPVELRVDKAECTTDEKFGSKTTVVRWSQQVAVPRRERVVTRKREIERVPVTNQTCSPTYTKTTSQPNPTGPGTIQNYMQSGQNCITTFGYEEKEVEVETVDYREHTDMETREMSAGIPTRTRHVTFAYRLAARVLVDANIYELTLDDKVELDDVEYTNPHGASVSFAPDARAILAARFSERSRTTLEGLILRSVRRSRVTELEASLEKETVREGRDAILAEICVLQSSAPPELVERVADRTGLPAPTIALGLAGGRRKFDVPYTDLGGEGTAAWALPKATPAAEREAFEDEDRQVIKERGLEVSGGLAIGAGGLARGGGPVFPYAALALRVTYVPAALLYRTVLGGLIFEAAGGIGHVLPVRGNAGLTGGIHAGPLTLLAEGVGGADGAFVNRDEGVAEGPNEPDVSFSPLLGYGARATLRFDPINIVAVARRNHRFVGALDLANVVEGALAYQVFLVGGRYETFSDVFTSTQPARAPWALTFTLGIAFDVYGAAAGEMTGRPVVAGARPPPTGVSVR